MQGVITKKDVVTNPLTIIEGFGFKVFFSALLASDDNITFLDIVNECNEEEEHKDMDSLELTEIVNQFIGYELNAREIYAHLSRHFKEYADVSKFFRNISRQEEGHALVLARVRREIKRGHYWKESKRMHASEIEAFDVKIKGAEAAVEGDVSLADALKLVEALEGSEINTVFDNLKNSVDMKSRHRFERFFVMSDEHMRYCESHVADFRKKYNLTQS